MSFTSRWLGLLLLVTFAAPVAAQQIPNVSLAPGEAVAVSIDPMGRSGPPVRRDAQWTAFDLYAARHLTGMDIPDAPVPYAMTLTPGPEGPKREPIPANQLRFRFFSIADRHALLVVENGYSRPLRYRARMTSDGKTNPTDVCIVLANFPSYEHWPHAIDRIDLHDFEFVSLHPGQSVTCE